MKTLAFWLYLKTILSVFVCSLLFTSVVHAAEQQLTIDKEGIERNFQVLKEKVIDPAITPEKITQFFDSLQQEEELFSSLSKEDRKRYNYLQKLIIDKINQGDYTTALRASHVIRRIADLTLTTNYLIITYFYMNYFDQMYHATFQLIKKQPYNETILYNHAEMLFSKKELAKAIEVWQFILKLHKAKTTYLEAIGKKAKQQSNSLLHFKIAITAYVLANKMQQKEYQHYYLDYIKKYQNNDQQSLQYWLVQIMIAIRDKKHYHYLQLLDKVASKYSFFSDYLDALWELGLLDRVRYKQRRLIDNLKY